MGPTASGKTSLSIKIAQHLDGEIVSADSMQVYKDIDIGTAKATPEEIAAAPHHLIDIFDMHQYIDVYKYVDLAEEAISDIRKRDKQPILAGGTGFYIKALLYGLDPLPGDKKVRKQLDEEYDAKENYEKLKKVVKELNPVDYERWHMHQRKLIRALEVFKLTGKSITELQTIHQPKLRFPVKSFWLNWDREELKKRIRLRTSQMLAAGWIDEAKDVLAKGILETPTAHQVLGYRIINDYLNGDLSYEEIEDKIATKTWQFARRQITWFRNQHPEAKALDMPLADENLFVSNIWKNSLTGYH